MKQEQVHVQCFPLIWMKMSVEVNKIVGTFNTLAGNPFYSLNEVNYNIEEDMESDEGDCNGAYLSSDNDEFHLGKRKYFT